MRDVGSIGGTVMTARLIRNLTEHEARERNALAVTKPGLQLAAGDVVRVVDTFDQGTHFLVEFDRGGKQKKDTCDWMGVLKATEIEVVDVKTAK
jgi:hypothetical protein